MIVTYFPSPIALGHFSTCPDNLVRLIMERLTGTPLLMNINGRGLNVKKWPTVAQKF